MTKTKAKLKKKSTSVKGISYTADSQQANKVNSDGLGERREDAKPMNNRRAMSNDAGKFISIDNTQKQKEAGDQFYEKKPETKKHNMWGNFSEPTFSEDLKNSINNFVNLANNSIYGIMHISNDCTKQTQSMLSKISTGISNTIEQNMELSGSFLKCQTAVDMIELQQKFFEMNFANIINVYSDVGHCCQSMATSCCENASVCTEKSVKCFGC